MSLLERRCDRCSSLTIVTKVSWFNLDALCPACQDIEREHPDYKYAKEVENAAVLRGDYNFPGVGWPGVHGRVNR